VTHRAVLPVNDAFLNDFPCQITSQARLISHKINVKDDVQVKIRLCSWWSDKAVVVVKIWKWCRNDISDSTRFEKDVDSGRKCLKFLQWVIRLNS
jgi:hypothetical protein